MRLDGLLSRMFFYTIFFYNSPNFTMSTHILVHHILAWPIKFSHMELALHVHLPLWLPRWEQMMETSEGTYLVWQVSFSQSWITPRGHLQLIPEPTPLPSHSGTFHEQEINFYCSSSSFKAYTSLRCPQIEYRGPVNLKW